MFKITQYSFIRHFKEIFYYESLKRKRQFWILLAGMVVVGALETLTAGIVAVFISAVSNPAAVLNSSYIVKLQQLSGVRLSLNTQHLIFLISFLVVGIMALQVFARLVIDFFVSLYAGYVSNVIGEKLLTGFLHVPYEWILSRNTADFIQSIQVRIQVGLYLKGTLKALSDIVVVMMMLTSLLIIAPRITFFIICIVFMLSYLIFAGSRKYLDQISIKVRDYIFLINRQIHKAMLGIKDVKITNREYLFTRTYHTPAFRHAKLTAFQDILSQSPRMLLEFMGIFLMATVVCIMFFFMNSESVTITGMIALFAAVGWRILPAVTRIIAQLSILRINMPYVQLILGYLNEIVPLISNQSHISSVSEAHSFNFSKQIVFKNVSFSYCGYSNHVLNGLEFNIQKGQTIGVIGVSGAGKSTLIDLLIGLLSPTTGEIIIDGSPLKGSIARDWMRNIGYVPQSPYICVGSIAENIAFGFTGNEIDRNRVTTCCTMAAMDDFLWSLPEGIDTQIGERGVKLSGGQQQRVAIARALYHTPDVLIFDEATSSLDTKSEKAIQKTIYSLQGTHTMIIIAHRLSSVENCDGLIWLEKGRVKKIGIASEIIVDYKISMKDRKSAEAA